MKGESWQRQQRKNNKNQDKTIKKSRNARMMGAADICRFAVLQRESWQKQASISKPRGPSVLVVLVLVLVRPGGVMGHFRKVTDTRIGQNVKTNFIINVSKVVIMTHGHWSLLHDRSFNHPHFSHFGHLLLLMGSVPKLLFSTPVPQKEEV